MSGFRAMMENEIAAARRDFDRGDAAAGMARLDRFPGLLHNDVEVVLLYARMLRQAGRIEDAEAMFARAGGLAPDRAIIVADRAALLASLDRRPEALAMLEAFLAAYPGGAEAFERYLLVLLAEKGPQAALAALAGRDPAERARAAERLRQKMLSLFDAAEIARLDTGNLLGLEAEAVGSGYTLRRMYEGFEAIGANCELGFAQRHRGAEPLGLMRWTSITPDSLVRLLASGLEGYERPDIYDVRVIDDEFILRENVYGTQTHTGVNQADLPADEFLARVTRRQGFLKRKFLEDMAVGTRIFAFKANDPLDGAVMDALERELGRHGVRRTLFVMRDDDRDRAGTVEFPSESRAVGRISSVMPNYRFDEWDRIVAATHDHFVGRGA